MGYYFAPQKEDLVELLMDLREYMSDRADVDDTESDVDHPQGVRPNNEMDFMTRINFILKYHLGIDPEAGNVKPSEEEPMDNTPVEDEMMNESVQKIKAQFKRFI